VKGEFQKMFKENAKELFEQNQSFFRQFDKLDGTGKIRDWEDLYNVSNSSEFINHSLIKTIIKVE
jgi:hypothetical protein